MQGLDARFRLEPKAGRKQSQLARHARGCACSGWLLAAQVFGQGLAFDFGSGAAAGGYTSVGPGQLYSDAAGFGFEPGASIRSVLRPGPDELRRDFVTADTEFLFSVKVPQGNYHVTFYLGDAEAASTTTVQAENRRMLFDRATASAGQWLAPTLTVNKREAKSIDGTVTMTLKERELTYYTWDSKLTFRFSGSRPAVAGLSLEPAANALTVYLCGNSTVVDQLDANDSGWCSWGQMIPRFFKKGVAVANYAESGLTSGNFLSMKRLQKLLSEARRGDYVFVEFGHNDQKSETDVANYPANLKTFRDQILAKNAIPVFVTPTARKGEEDPKTSIGGLAEVMRQTAKQLNVAVIDLNAMTITLNRALGAKNAAVYIDGTHFMRYGAYELARCVARAIKDADNSLTPLLAEDIAPFDPAQPDATDILLLPGTPTGLLKGRARVQERSSRSFGRPEYRKHSQFRKRIESAGHADRHISVSGRREPG